MSELLEVPAIRERALRFSVEDYHRLDDERDTELLRGTIIEKMPTSPLHRHISNRLQKILSRQTKPGYLCWHEAPLTLKDSEPKPDLCIVRGQESDFVSIHPSTAELVIEVSISSREIDQVKASIYAQAEVQEYWIVSPQDATVELFRGPAGRSYSVYEVLASPAVLNSRAAGGLELKLAELFETPAGA